MQATVRGLDKESDTTERFHFHIPVGILYISSLQKCIFGSFACF